jgi:hypothetical protein
MPDAARNHILSWDVIARSAAIRSDGGQILRMRFVARLIINLAFETVAYTSL